MPETSRESREWARIGAKRNEHGPDFGMGLAKESKETKEKQGKVWPSIPSLRFLRETIFSELSADEREEIALSKT
jgi:hypothetical protein